MGGEGSTFETLLEHLDAAIATFPDRRVGKNCHYAVRDAALSAFSVFFLQSPSFLSHQRLMQASNGEDNARTVFGVHEIPSDNCIRTLLDPVPPDRCFPVYGKVRNLLAERGELESWRDVFGTFPVALDGVWFHSSEEIHCENCSTRRHGDGRTTYFHSAITPVMVRPGSGHVLALEPEYIGPRDGTEKQDCEINASKRWLDGAGAVYAAEGMTLLGDDLYAKQPFCEKVNEAGAHFLFTCKSSSHKYLYDWIGNAEVGVDVIERVERRWNGKERLYDRYRFMNDVPIRAGDDALRVNWCELRIVDGEGKVRSRFAYVTDHAITRDTVISVVATGRARWKIENEHNNTLKTKGYNLEHNFGHGKKHLSNLLLTLNLLAFLFHTVLELFDRRYILLRKAIGRRQSFFDDIRALTRYWCFDGWDDLLRFMLRGLKIPDPGG